MHISRISLWRLSLVWFIVVNLGSIWVKIRAKLGPTWVQSKLGLNWEQLGPNLSQFSAKLGPNWNQILVK